VDPQVVAQLPVLMFRELLERRLYDWASRATELALAQAIWGLRACPTATGFASVGPNPFQLRLIDPRRKQPARSR
jgi:hypothetical protein